MHTFRPHPLQGLAAAALWLGTAQAAEPTIPLQTVVVSATRHAMPLADAPAAIEVVNAEALAQRGTDNLLTALRGQTGINVFGRTISGRKGLSLRGMDPRHTLVLVDGQRISASDGVVGHSDFQLDWAGQLDIERVEVLRGPMSVLYGAEALGGVVNIITRALPDTLQGEALAEGRDAAGDAGGDGHRLAAALRGPLGGGLRFGLSVSDQRVAALASAADHRVSALEGRRRGDAGLRLQWQPTATHAMELNARAGHEDRWAGARERSAPRRTHQSLHDLARRHLSLGWQAGWGGAADLQTQLRVYEARLGVANLKTNGVASLKPQALHDAVAEGQLAASPWAAHRLTGGFEWRREALRNEALPGGRGVARHPSLYLQDEWATTATLATTAGLRWDRHSQFGGQWSPRAYAVWKLAPGWVAKGGVAHGYKAPTLKQAGPDYQEDEGPNTFFGNPALVPETNRSVEAGLAWEHGSLGLQGMLFHNRIRHLIVARQFDNLNGRGQYRFENIDNATLAGLEAAVRWRGSALDLQGRYTALHAVDGTGQRLEKRPRQQLSLAADWQGLWAGRAWQAGLTVVHQAGMLLASANTALPPQPVPDLTHLGLHASLALTPEITVRAGVDNLTNLSLADKSPLFTYAEAPRTWRLGLHARW